jgi:hypothetical protein
MAAGGRRQHAPKKPPSRRLWLAKPRYSRRLQPSQPQFLPVRRRKNHGIRVTAAAASIAKSDKGDKGDTSDMSGMSVRSASATVRR